MFGLSTGHILLMLVVVILIFGTSKLKNLGKDLGGAVKGFKDAMGNSDDDKSQQPPQQLTQQPPQQPSATEQNKKENV